MKVREMIGLEWFYRMKKKEGPILARFNGTNDIERLAAKLYRISDIRWNLLDESVIDRDPRVTLTFLIIRRFHVL